jgi:hypothetical protein
MISVLLQLLVVAVVLSLFIYVLGLIPGLPVWVRPIFILVAILFVLLWVLGGHLGGI